MIDFVPSLGAVLGSNDAAGSGIDGDAQRIAMAERINLRAGALNLREGIIVGDAAVICDPQYFSVNVVRALSGVDVTVADGTHSDVDEIPLAKQNSGG